MKMIFILITLVFVLEGCSNSKQADTPSAGPYFPKVKTIVQLNCLTCHDPSGSWQGRPTDLSSDDKIVQLAASIKAAVADPVTITNHRMPQGGQLSQADINTIVNWFNKGGKATD